MTLRIIDRVGLKAQFQWEPTDLWVGVFWRFNYQMPRPYHTLHVCIGLVPMFPFHVTVLRRNKP